MDSVSLDAKSMILARPASAQRDAINLAKDAHGNVNPAEVAKGFEQIFMTQLIQEMTKSLKGGFFGEGSEGHVYEGLFENFLAQKITESGGMGIAPIVEKAIAQREGA